MSNYYVSGCIGDGDAVATCDDDVAQFWTLYHRNDEGLSTAIIDCMSREDAEAAMLVYERRDAMAAENAAMRGAISYVCDTDNQPDYQYDGMGCGIEDLGIVGRYEAARYAWDEAIERMYSEVISFAEDIETPATDAYLNSVRAEGVEMVKSHPAISLCSLTHVCEEIAAQLRSGKDGE